MLAPPLHRTQHYQNLDAVRGIAAQFVVVVHVILLIASNDPVYKAITGWPGWLSGLCGSFLIANLVAYCVARVVERPAQFSAWIEQILFRRSGSRRAPA
jgi:hypothetical protein